MERSALQLSQNTALIGHRIAWCLTMNNAESSRTPLPEKLNCTGTGSGHSGHAPAPQSLSLSSVDSCQGEFRPRNVKSPKHIVCLSTDCEFPADHRVNCTIRLNLCPEHRTSNRQRKLQLELIRQRRA